MHSSDSSSDPLIHLTHRHHCLSKTMNGNLCGYFHRSHWTSHSIHLSPVPRLLIHLTENSCSPCVSSFRTFLHPAFTLVNQRWSLQTVAYLTHKWFSLREIWAVSLSSVSFSDYALSQGLQFFSCAWALSWMRHHVHTLNTPSHCQRNSYMHYS